MSSNPLFDMYGSNSSGGNDIMSKFNTFKNSFQGDPKAKVQELLNTGQMTQEQFNMLSNLAQQFMTKR